MDAKRLQGFPPVFRADAQLLILGSMPSVESLRQRFYYAHPRNAFWRIMADILDETQPETIEEKKRMLVRNRIALWDTVCSCTREGSLDSAIRGVEANDFSALYAACKQIRTVVFNGAAAESLYRRWVGLDAGRRYRRLPSTSPAYTMKYEDKLSQWKPAIEEALQG